MKLRRTAIGTNGILTVNPAVENATGGLIFLSDSASAGNAMFTLVGGAAPFVSGGCGADSGSGFLTFSSFSTAGNANLIANGGFNEGPGGGIFFRFASTGGTARVLAFGNGYLDISGHDAPGLTSRPSPEPSMATSVLFSWPMSSPL